MFEDVVKTTNANLASYEQIKKHTVLPLMLSIDDGTLTPTLKVKRRVVEKQYTRADRGPLRRVRAHLRRDRERLNGADPGDESGARVDP